jgi:hypothetical protein
MSHLSVEVYSTGTTPIADIRGELRGARNIRFGTYYPGGVYGNASLEVSRKLAEYWAVNGGQRLVLRSGLEIVYEGALDNLLARLAADRSQSMELNAVGKWGAVMKRRMWNKPWADKRIDEAVWPVKATTYIDRYTYDRYNRLMIVPKGVAFGASVDDGGFEYNAPTGETIKRVTCSYDMQEAGQAWELFMYDRTNLATIWSVTASGTGTQDVTLATPASKISLDFTSRAAQTPAADGTIYGKITNLVVYTETGSINLTEIAKDIRTELGELNTTEMFIGSNTKSIVPFVTDGWEAMGDILARAAGFGDASYNAWAAYLGHSELAPTPNGEPVLVVEQKPALTSSDYLVRLEDLQSGGEFEYYFDDLWNWIVVEYQDAATTRALCYSPDNDANLKDQASIDKYGQRDYPLKVETTLYTDAVAAGRRFLAEHKDPKFRMSRPLTLQGMVQRSGGGFVSAAQVRAGKRMRIANYFQDLSGTGLTFLVSSTEYDDETETVQVSGGDGGLLGIGI